MKDIILYRKMISPGVIIFLSYCGMVIVFIGALSGMSNNLYPSPITGLIIALLGPLVIRMNAEFILLLFRLFDSVRNIEKKLNAITITKKD
jgi:hypothetical protein